MGLWARSLSCQTIGSYRRRNEATLERSDWLRGPTESGPRSSEADFGLRRLQGRHLRPAPRAAGRACSKPDFIALGPLDTAAVTR
jgi:hypothetical protein